MRVLIVEDEPPIAEDLERRCRAMLGEKLAELRVAHTLEEAKRSVQSCKIDLCLLDLNLSGESGFALLEEVLGRSFHTIIISAHTDQALRAFEYGVLDFIPKPYTEVRLRLALDRYFGQVLRDGPEPKVLIVRQGSLNRILEVGRIEFFKADRYLAEAHQFDGKMDLLDKSLDKLEILFPKTFYRSHRSYLVRLSEVASYKHAGSGAYRIVLKSGISIPLSRRRVRDLRSRING